MRRIVYFGIRTAKGWSNTVAISKKLWTITSSLILLHFEFSVKKKLYTSVYINTFDYQSILFRLDERVNSSMTYGDSHSPGFDNRSFLQSRKQSLTSVMNHLANNSDQESSVSNSDDHSKTELAPSEESGSSVISESTQDFNNHAILKIVSEMHVARPEGLRLLLRDVIMFLLVSNACLWVFLSLSGTAFMIFQYQLVFYGGSAWTTISMICRPLNIFFRMHSAGCLFEMWSFA